MASRIRQRNPSLYRSLPKVVAEATHRRLFDSAKKILNLYKAEMLPHKRTGALQARIKRRGSKQKLEQRVGVFDIRGESIKQGARARVAVWLEWGTKHISPGYYLTRSYIAGTENFTKITSELLAREFARRFGRKATVPKTLR